MKNVSSGEDKKMNKCFMSTNSTVLILNSFNSSLRLKYILSTQHHLTNEVLFRQTSVLNPLLTCHYLQLPCLAGFMHSWKPNVCLCFQFHIPSFHQPFAPSTMDSLVPYRPTFSCISLYLLGILYFFYFLVWPKLLTP